MKHYYWKGIDSVGASCKGLELASSPDDLKKLLLAKNVAILSWYEKKSFFDYLWFPFSRKLKEQELLFFFEQLSIQLEHGLPLLKALTLLQKSTSNSLLTEFIAFLITNIQHGESFSHALSAYPHYKIPYLYLIQAGELTGTLAQSLSQVAAILERNLTLKAAIRTAIRMPLFTLIFACVLIASLIAFVIPQFATIFGSLDKPLPLATRHLIQLSVTITSTSGLIIGAVVFLAVITSIWASRNTTVGKKIIERYMLNSFIFGPIKKLTYGIAILDLISTLLRAGMPLRQAMQIVCSTYQTPFLTPLLAKILHDVEQGLPLHVCLETHLPTIFPNLITAMINVGEQTGNLSAMLTKSAQALHQALNKRLIFMTTIIQPVLLIVVGLIIVFIMTCIYIPIFSMADIL